MATKLTATKEMKVEKQLSSLATRVLLRPRITEKAYAVNALDQYVFQVVGTATKTEVKRAVEEAYGVSVVAVHIVRLPGKRKNLGRTVGQRSAVKKALVRLKKGESIQLFQAGI
jgi:large subunit ribosomal protein L23